MRPFAVVTVATAVSLASACGASRPARHAGAPNGPAAIDHVVVLMQENRSFDNYLGELSRQGQPGAEGTPDDASNPNPTNRSGPPVRRFHENAYCEAADLDHSWTGSHDEWDAGRMDGFTAANVDPADPAGRRSMAYYDRSDLPFYYDLYSTFAMGDRYFASVLGPTFPNRFYLLTGTSFGHIRNDFPPADGFTQRSIFNLLDEAHVSWKVYYSQLPFAFELSYVRDHAAGHAVPIGQYYTDARAGLLPQVAFVDPIFTGPNTVENDEHPPTNVQVGERFAAGVIDALFHSPNWSRSALFLSYDEHGGYFDHVAPPPAPAPDEVPPMLRPGDAPARFDRYGFRVPFVVVSPFARRHHVSHTVYDHTSILRFLEKRFGLPALTKRDASANAPMDMFDFSHRSFTKPPRLAAAPVDPAKLAACAARARQMGAPGREGEEEAPG